MLKYGFFSYDVPAEFKQAQLGDHVHQGFPCKPRAEKSHEITLPTRREQKKLVLDPTHLAEWTAGVTWLAMPLSPCFSGATSSSSVYRASGRDSWHTDWIAERRHGFLEQEWLTNHWHIIHRGVTLTSTAERSSGLFAIDIQKIMRHEPMPGRLLHCRLHLQKQTIDISGAYQYPWNGSQNQMNRLGHLWQKITHLLEALPKRNLLAMLGDFNCSLPDIPRLVGTSTFLTDHGRRHGPQHSDQDFLPTLWRTSILWHSTLGPMQMDQRFMVPLTGTSLGYAVLILPPNRWDIWPMLRFFSKDLIIFPC